jgi:hypothetical protein
MASEDDSFFSRWSRRKQAVREGQALPAQPLAPAKAEGPVQPAGAAATVATPFPAPDEGAAPADREASPPPTLDDVASLTPEADFSRFVASDVSSEVRNAAVKKLFADPRFNVMDGLDVYIDDYSQPSPLSKADMAKMVGARFLKLVDDPDEEKAPASTTEPSTPSGAPTAAAPGDTVADTPPTHDDHADLQLQPDDVPGRESPGHGAG